MRLDLNIHQQMTQRMILAPRMIQAMEILQLPILALEQRLQQEVQENPVLEAKEGMSNEQTDDDPLEDFDYGEDRYQEEHRPSRNRREEEADRKHDALQSTP